VAEKTLVLIKPDAVQRKLAGEILARFENRGLAILGAKLVKVDRALAEQHYAEHAEKPFFAELVAFITSAPTLALVLEGEGAIHRQGRLRACHAGQPGARLRRARVGGA
jgi:nucleoside-diphosphate kinase